MANKQDEQLTWGRDDHPLAHDLVLEYWLKHGFNGTHPRRVDHRRATTAWIDDLVLTPAKNHRFAEV